MLCFYVSICCCYVNLDLWGTGKNVNYVNRVWLLSFFFVDTESKRWGFFFVCLFVSFIIFVFVWSQTLSQQNVHFFLVFVHCGLVIPLLMHVFSSNKTETFEKPFTCLHSIWPQNAYGILLLIRLQLAWFEQRERKEENSIEATVRSLAPWVRA